MNEYIFHANGWTVNVEPVYKSPGSWAAIWTAARGAPTLVGQLQHEVEIRSSGELALLGSQAEAATRAKSDWLGAHGPVENRAGAEFVEPMALGDWHVAISVQACDMTHSAPIWWFHGTAIQPLANAKENFSSKPFRYSSTQEAFAEAERMLTQRYGPRR